MEVQEEHDKLTALEEAAHQSVQQFGACSLGDKVKNQKLAAGVNDKLSQIRAVHRDLELLFEELDGDEERQQVAALLSRHKAEYERILQAFKQAALQQRQRAAQSAAEERKELLAGAADPAAKQRQLAMQGELVAASEGVTEGLRRTRQVLAEQLEHTSTTLAAMEQSHAALGKTRDEYHTQAGVLKQSKGLLGTLNWQQTAERMMLWVGLALFALVVAYIVQKRVGYFLPSALSPTALLSGAARSGAKHQQPAPLHAQVPLGAVPPSSAPVPGAGEVPGLPPHFEHRGQEAASGGPSPGEAPGLPPHFEHRGQEPFPVLVPVPSQQAPSPVLPTPASPHPQAGLGQEAPAPPPVQQQQQQPQASVPMPPVLAPAPQLQQPAVVQQPEELVQQVQPAAHAPSPHLPPAPLQQQGQAGWVPGQQPHLPTGHVAMPGAGMGAGGWGGHAIPAGMGAAELQQQPPVLQAQPPQPVFAAAPPDALAGVPHQAQGVEAVLQGAGAAAQPAAEGAAVEGGGAGEQPAAVVGAEGPGLPHLEL